MKLTFPVGPLGSKKNSYTVIRRNGKASIAPNAKSRAVGKALIADIQAAMWKFRATELHRYDWPLPPPYRVTVQLAKGTRTDIDNSAGHLLDSLQRAGMIRNDRDVERLVVERTDGPVTLVTVEYADA